MRLADFIGQNIVISIPSLDPTKVEKVKLLGVEAGGIWIESETINNLMLRALKLAALPRSPRVFLPYGQISIVMVGGGVPALDEKAFGLE